MKIKSFISALLAFVMIFSLVSCDFSQGTQGNVEDPVEYDDPNAAFSTYDNKSYNEYLLGEDVKIANQWEGYGIGDPFIMRYNGMYYLYCSTLDSETGVRGYKSADLMNWVPMTGAGLREGYVSQDNVTKAAYAPEVYYFNGTFYMYTSPAGAGHYILTSDSPEGPFVKATNNFGMSIDGSILIDDDETIYFTYASQGGIRIAKMSDMLTVDATSTPQLNNTSIGGWTEGSYILKRDGVYYLTFTGTHVASDGYRIAYATASALVNANGALNRNAFTRAENNPLALNTEGALKGIGHSSTVLGPDMDSYYLAYHMLNSSGGPNRSLGIDRLLFNGTQMSVATNLEGSIAPALPIFYANGIDAERFDVSDGLVLSKSAHNANFSAEFNVTGAEKSVYVFGYVDGSNYNSVSVDLTAKTITLASVINGEEKVVATGTLVNDFKADKLHTVRIAARDGKVDVVFDNMTKIDNAELSVASGKIGYKGLVDSAEIGYTAFSNVAMGMSDEAEAKQALGTIGASLYLREETYSAIGELSSDAVMVLEDYPYAGVKALQLAKGENASYLVNFKEGGRYALELVYRAADGGKKMGMKLADGNVLSFVLPKVETDEDYVKAFVCEANIEAGIKVVRLEAIDGEVQFMSFSFVEASNSTPEFSESLADYVTLGADYKTIWKIKDEGHYAKAGTRQLVYFGDDTITDFTLEVDIKLEGKTGTSSAGIVFHASNYAASSHDNYTSMQGYYLSVNNNQILLERLNYADDTNTIATYVKGNPFAESDKFVTVKIQVRGNQITVWADGEMIIQVSDAVGYTHGKLGLYTNGSAVVFKNLKVSE
ncbi:MAG: family 43 glycosylhydrolase [Clostridia bacterium]|nr:family 43 glycosylhydrolase [Clostridia bacterium]